MDVTVTPPDYLVNRADKKYEGPLGNIVRKLRNIARKFETLPFREIR